MPLPDVPADLWAVYQADQFSQQADRRIDTMTFSTAVDAKIGSLDQFQAPTSSDSLTNPIAAAPPSSDSLTNPLGTGNAGSVADNPPPSTAVPSMSPSPTPDVSAPAPPDLPTPDAPPQLTPVPTAPPTLDFGTSAPRPIVAPAAASSSPSDSRAPVSSPAPTSSSSGPFTETTAALSGGGSAAASGLTGDASYLLSAGGQLASWLGADGQKAVQSVLVTEGGLNKARGDSGKSAGPFQFYEQGQLANYARARNLTLDQAKAFAEANPLDAMQWAIGSQDQPGYLGAAVQRGMALGLRGADLATYVQRTGQVSVSPERAGANYNALFANTTDPYTIDTSATTNVPGSYTPGPDEGLRRVGSGLDKQQSDISQFNDPQLTTEEAYAACGPAAAVRFAQKFGRNPTLREALDLAKTPDPATGALWDQTNGMHGLASEKALMDKLGVPTKMVNGAQWDVFAKEAQTGNPVTISTAGHYFTADGYNADTGAFHVGRSGLDLKGGSEWMTPAQMTNLMGPVQGGLLADNPQVPQPSTAQQDSNPLDWLGRQKDALASGIGSTVDGFFSGVSDAASAIVSPPRGQPMTAAEQPTPSDSLTNPLGTGNAATSTPVRDTPPITPSNNPPADQTIGNAVSNAASTAGQVVSDLYSAVPQGSILKGGLNASNAAIPATDSSTSTMRPGGALALQAESDFQRQRTADDQEANALGAKIQAGTATPDEQQRFYEIGLNNAMAVAGEDVKLPSGGAYRSVMSSGAFERTPAATPTNAPSEAVANVRRNLTRAFFDRQVDINQAQEQYARALGRPLNADEMAAELQRLAADPAAQVKIDEGLKPAVQSVGDDYDALRDYVTLRSNVQVAAAKENADRLFSGNLTAADSQRRMGHIEDQLGPDRFAKVKAAADQVSDFSRQTRERLVESGVLSQEQSDTLDRLYPDWAKTRVLDYMSDTTGGQGAGTKIGLADRQLRQYSVEGTTKAREDPLASTVAYAHQVERMANKNEAFNAMLKIDQASPRPMLRRVAQDFSPTRDQVTMVGFVDGQKVKYVTDNKALGQAINGAGVMATPEWTSAWQRVFRSLATSRNPLFLAGNAALDIPTYTFRTAIRDGGPQALPGIMADLAKGYADAFQGLLQGEFRGKSTAEFLKGGGGQSGYFTGGEGLAKQAVADLRRRNVFQISTKADLGRIVKDLATLQPVESLGERIELGPRVAAYNRALKRGANPVQAVIDGRTVTVDFSQGGTVTKYLNNFVPFANVGFQGPVQLARAWRDNPRAFVATAGTLIGLPTVAAEVWNRADPQRAQDYADVPQYIKDQGVVVMLPGDAPVDAQGNRKPLYAVIKLREWAPIASIARNATARALGDDSKSLAEMARSAGVGLSPTQSSSVGELGNEALSGIPVVPAALQLEQNRDFFRNRDIVTNRNDQNASAAAKALTPVIQSAVDNLGLNMEIRPSAVDFFIRNQGAGVGSAVLGGSDVAAGKARQDTSPTSLPGVGGLVGRFVGNQTGQGLQSARDVVLTTSARRILRDSGITSTPGPVGSEINRIPIKLDEEARYQQLANRYIDEAIHRVATSPEFASMTPQGKQSLMQGAIDAAKGKAGLEVLNTIPDSEKQRRLTAKTTGPSAPAVAGATR